MKKITRQYKTHIKEEQAFYYNIESTFLSKARTNTLKLQDWKGFNNDNNTLRGPEIQ